MEIKEKISQAEIIITRQQLKDLDEILKKENQEFLRDTNLELLPKEGLMNWKWSIPIINSFPDFGDTWEIDFKKLK